MQKYQYFNGIKFTRDEKTGYYLNSTIRKRMHRYVWEFYNGEIPKGYQIHHKDKDKANNDISNLEMIPRSYHAEFHSKEKARERRAEMVENLKVNAIPKAVEWHKSTAGREWHKKQYEATKDRFQEKKPAICQMCGKEYMTPQKSTNKFCSNKCKSAWRRKSGLDDEERICSICGKAFTANKYSKIECCSRSCSNRKRSLK